MIRAYTPFVYLKRRKRSELYIRLRWRIRCTANIYGGQFTSHQLLDEPGRPALYNQWADVCFCGSDNLTIWNATIISATSDFWDKAEEMAHTRAWEMLTPEEQRCETEMKFEPIWHNGRKFYQIVEREKMRYEKFGGLTYYEYQDKLTDEIVQNEPPEIYESFEMDRSYRYGVGLHIVIQADEINRRTIEQAIDGFRGIGETNWRADNPVPRDELPKESRKAVFARIQEAPTI